MRPMSGGRMCGHSGGYSKQITNAMPEEILLMQKFQTIEKKAVRISLLECIPSGFDVKDPLYCIAFRTATRLQDSICKGDDATLFSSRQCNVPHVKVVNTARTCRVNMEHLLAPTPWGQNVVKDDGSQDEVSNGA